MRNARIVPLKVTTANWLFCANFGKFIICSCLHPLRRSPPSKIIKRKQQKIYDQSKFFKGKIAQRTFWIFMWCSSLRLSPTHSTHLFSSCAKCLKNGIINGFSCCVLRLGRGEKRQKINKIIISHFSFVNQIMICWLFLLINCSTFPLICAQTHPEGKSLRSVCLMITRASDFHETIHFYQLNSETVLPLRGRKWKVYVHAIIKRHSLPFHFISLARTYHERAFCVIDVLFLSDAQCLMDISSHLIREGVRVVNL